MNVLAIESSCDETSISIVKDGSIDIATSTSTQIDIHKKYGGVVPEVASRHHIENIIFVLDDVFKKSNMSMDDIDVIAVTYGPGLIGSLLVGVEAAKTLSFCFNKPLVPVHHISGHIYANNLENKMEFPLLALIVSGGHTELVLMEDHFKYNILGSTLDDAVGECYDKVARVMNLEYPGGPKIDELARLGKHSYKLPIPLNDNSYNFSFSGLKSAVLNLVNKEKMKGNSININDLATSFQEVAINSIINKTKKAILDFNIKNVIVAGGVASNSYLRDEIKNLSQELNFNLTIPKLKYCTDNATMIGAAGYFLYKQNKTSDLLLNAVSQDILK